MPHPEPIPLSNLPHGEEARLLTRAVLDTGSGVVRGFRETDPGRAPCASGAHFPAWQIIELMAQTAGLGLPPGGGAVVAGISRMRLHRAALATDPVEVEAHLDRRLGPLFVFECRATSGGSLLAGGTIVLRRT